MNLIDYFEQRRPRQYQTEWHDRWVCTLLQRALEERKNLIVEMHPRSGKSEKVNQYAPAWWLESHPDATFGLVTSEDGLAAKFVSGTRRLLSPSYKFDLERQNEFKIAGTQGLDLSYTGRGIHSNLSGRGFDCLMLDDCLKSGTDAMSENVRERLWTDVISAAVNRLSPQGIIIALQARLHQQDVIGRLLDTGMKFMRLHLPATNDAGDAAYVEDGYSGERTIFPPYKFLTRRYPRPKLDEIRATVSEYYWMAQYAQEPSLGNLAFFKTDNLPRYDFPDVVRCWTSWDCAQTATKSGSFSAGIALGLTQDDRLQILDVRRGRWTQDQLEEEIVNHTRNVARLTGILPEAVIVERAAAGFGIIDRLDGILPIVPLIPKGSKEDRAASVCSLVNRGLVLFPVQAPWLGAFLEELASFPLGRTKDQVDSFVHALSYVARPSEFVPVKSTSLVVFDPLASPATEEELAEHMEYVSRTTIGGDTDW
jgi:predicted phage terminase large subunit-like protein